MSNKEKNFVSAVIYVHNAANRIEQFLKTVAEVLEENFEHSEIICVNDFSDDDSVKVIKAVSDTTKETSISVINMSYFHGLELSMNAGMDLSIGDFVFEFDNTTLDFDKIEIMNIYRRSLQGFDIVSASPSKRGKFTSRLFYRVFGRYAHLGYQMRTESFRILSRRVINRIKSMNKTVPYRKAVYANCGLKTDNVLYNTVKVTGVDSDRQESRYRTNLAMDSLILFTDLGYTFARNMTFIMILAAVFTAIYSLVVYFTGNPVEGWTTTILFLAFSFFGLFGILTIIIKYLQIMVNLVFKRQRYSFESIEKMTK